MVCTVCMTGPGGGRCCLETSPSSIVPAHLRRHATFASASGLAIGHFSFSIFCSPSLPSILRWSDTREPDGTFVCLCGGSQYQSSIESKKPLGDLPGQQNLPVREKMR